MEEKIQRLSEGMDFIEESVGYGEPLKFTEVDDNVISESSVSKPSQYKVLGRCSGNFQPIGEFSRNKRLYSRDLWPKLLENEDLKSRLARRGVFGCLGHADKLVDDRDIQEGKVSHIVTLLEVREDKKGNPFLYGELEILDTPAGRILEAMYKGGADLYVSSRAAGKLFPVPGQDYSLVKPEQYTFHCFDIVCRPGFLQARPAFEAMPEVEAKPTLQEGAQTPLFQQPQLNEMIAKKQSQQPKQEQSNEELQLLKGQIDKLTKILEKVVDDVYETEEQPQEQSIEEQLGNLLLNPSVTDEAYEDVVAVLKNSNPELTSKIMENSRHKFNDEHGEKSGYKIDYYRFGGSKPYKIVPKDKSYFEASWDSPRYRTLKQAQKHILDTYKKPKEEDTNEALANFVNLMADTNISEKAFEEIVDMISKAKKESK